jgi:small subunit ribosomal protein S2
LRCIQVIAGVLGRAGEAGQKKRLEAAKKGDITWLPPPGLGKPKEEEEKENKAAGPGEPKGRGVELNADEVESGRRSGPGSRGLEEEDDD